MQPSSLVFLVIIGVWAAYFVQHWVRRREHLATVRSVDQFSESMRILDRQGREQEGAAGGARPQLLGRRARRADVVEDVDVAPSHPTRNREYAAPPRSRGRRRRGLAVVVAVLALLVVVPLAVLGMDPVVAAAAPAVLLLASVAVLRRGVARERAARRRARPLQAPTRRPVPTARPVAEHPVAEHPVAEHPVAEHPVAPSGTGRPRAELFDVQAYEPAPVAPAPVPEQVEVAVELPQGPLVDEDDIPLTWDPRPVPRPTYTMKSRVTRPAPTAADLVGDADTEYAAYDEQEPARRVAGA